MNRQILKHVIRYILMILIIVVCCIIFRFSSQQGEKSSSVSCGTTRKIVSILYRDLSENDIEIKVEYIDPIIRKVAHFLIYMLLGILLMCCSQTFRGKNIIRFDVDIILACIYASTDEWHQHFVPGRSGNIGDVGLDTVGATIGILIVMAIFIIARKLKERKDSKTKELPEKNVIINKRRRVIFIASTGGHLNELMQLKPLFDKYDYQIITEKNRVDKSLKEDYGKKLNFLIYGTRKHHIKYFFKFIANCFISLHYYFKFQPDVIVTTGTHTAVPMCYIAKIFGSKVIFIETFANRTSGTLAGKLVYPIADTFVIQWEEMYKIYPRAVCWGWIY